MYAHTYTYNYIIYVRIIVSMCKSLRLFLLYLYPSNSDQVCLSQHWTSQQNIRYELCSKLWTSKLDGLKQNRASKVPAYWCAWN